MKIADLKIIFIFGSMLLLSGCASGPQREVCFDGGCVKVELAQTPQEWEKGLSNRASLAKDSGMLFIFPVVEHYNFWMKDTLIPLDIIWFTESGYVLYIEKNLQPCKADDPCPSFGPSDPSRFVLEVNAGDADKLKLKEGSQVQFRFQL
jgi:uncharacterized membrane protein (UPF0127 family)